MTREEFLGLQKGDLVRHAHDTRPFVVMARYGDRATAVASVDMTNPAEWDRVDPAGRVKGPNEL